MSILQLPSNNDMYCNIYELLYNINDLVTNTHISLRQFSTNALYVFSVYTHSSFSFIYIGKMRMH
jgi:hypothetical protein